MTLEVCGTLDCRVVSRTFSPHLVGHFATADAKRKARRKLGRIYFCEFLERAEARNTLCNTMADGQITVQRRVASAAFTTLLFLPLAAANPPSWYTIVQPRVHRIRTQLRSEVAEVGYPDDPQFPLAERQAAATAYATPSVSHVPLLGGGLAAAALSCVALIVVVQTIQPGAVPAGWAETRHLLQEWSSVRTLKPQTAAGLAAFGMYAASDAMGQCVSSRKGRQDGATSEQLDVPRMLRSAACSALLSGWFAVIYFGMLDRYVRLPAWAAGKDGRLGAFLGCLPIVAKVAIDVGLYEPIYDTIYMSLQTILHGRRPDLGATIPKVLSVWAKAPLYWGLVDTINFALVSGRLRPLYNAVASIPWSMYLSQTANV
jgi:hypothetical protein